MVFADQVVTATCPVPRIHTRLRASPTSIPLFSDRPPTARCENTLPPPNVQSVQHCCPCSHLPTLRAARVGQRERPRAGRTFSSPFFCTTTTRAIDVTGRDLAHRDPSPRLLLWATLHTFLPSIAGAVSYAALRTPARGPYSRATRQDTSRSSRTSNPFSIREPTLANLEAIYEK